LSSRLTPNRSGVLLEIFLTVSEAALVVYLLRLGLTHLKRYLELREDGCSYGYRQETEASSVQVPPFANPLPAEWSTYFDGFESAQRPLSRKPPVRDNKAKAD
jgi:hypothetical protein